MPPTKEKKKSEKLNQPKNTTYVMNTTSKLPISLAVLITAALFAFLIYQNKQQNNTTQQTHAQQYDLAWQKQNTINQNLSARIKHNEKSTWKISFRLLRTQQLISLAQTQLLVWHNPKKAAQLLAEADKPLANTNDEKIQKVLRPRIAAMRAHIETIETPNLNERYNDFNQIENHILSWPKQNVPAQPKMKQAVSKDHPTDNKTYTWLEKTWRSTQKILGKMFIVHQEEDLQASSHFLPPEYLPTLQISLQLQLSQAQWAAQHRDQTTYLQSLNHMTDLLKKYGYLNLTQSKNLRDEINKLKTWHIAAKWPNLNPLIELTDELLMSSDLDNTTHNITEQPKKQTHAHKNPQNNTQEKSHSTPAPMTTGTMV